jgi:predicted DsbA family dithiol-disulfide isomerase
MSAIEISHFSDTLCVWAYVSQVRINELESEFGDQVLINYCLLPVFGHARSKLETQWKNKGGIEAYSQHVIGIVEQFGHVNIHPDIWLVATPHSSLPSHLFLSAVKIAESQQAVPPGSYKRLSWHFRESFFARLADISDQQVLYGLAEDLELPLTQIEEKITGGEAYAALSMDMQAAKDLAVLSSPTLIFNKDRQRLAGNVGYRIIRANISELLENPGSQQSWC